MKTIQEEYQWLATQGEKISFGQPSIEEKDEFVKYMYSKGQITPEEYDNYRGGKYADKILSLALTAGVVSLIGYFISKIRQKDSNEISTA